MQRITISVDDALAQEFDALVAQSGYENRSEAFRDLLREHLSRRRLETASAKEADVSASHGLATVSYVYDHHERTLSQRLRASQHEHHDLAVSVLHVHLDHDSCLEVMVLRGPLTEVKSYAERFIAQSGVRHGSIHLLPLVVEEGHDAYGHRIVHTHPIS